MWGSVQQNYAKFDSRVVNDAMVVPESINSYNNNYYEEEWFLNNVSFMVSNVGHSISMIINVLLWISAWLYFIYIVISLFSKWGKETITEIKDLFIRAWKNIVKFLSWILIVFRSIWKWIIWHKKWTALIVLWLIVINLVCNVIDWQSNVLKYIKIWNWFVGVDIKNEKIMKPGYHMYSPLTSDLFLSRTSVFDFEIVAVTANTKEDMFVELDYRVWFKFIEKDVVGFYKKFGAKSSRTVASDIVMPRVLEVLKWIIKEYSFKEISSKHNEIKTKAIKETNKVLNKLWIEMNDINVLDIRLPESYTKSIEDLENAENARKLAEAELEKEKKFADTAVVRAENEKSIKIIQAEAVAEYNNIVNNTKITNQVLELKRIENERFKIEKRDWKLPNTNQWNNFVNLKK